MGTGTLPFGSVNNRIEPVLEAERVSVKDDMRNFTKKKLLTISILISNRLETVRKCLDSVKPLLEQIASELILVDTGCGETVREIIEEYTDQIIDFEWCRDFSKARNVGLKKAKGKWFLYLDDDEWFEDVSDIIRFFNSGEYRDYGVGLYTQRNYLLRDGSEYTELLVGRMIRLEPDIRFIHKIHECFNRAPGIPKQLNAYVHHYGYIYQNAEEHEAHAIRNISLLQEEMEEQPRSMRNALQLAQEYNSISDREKSLKLSLESIAKAEHGKAEDEYCLPPLYANEINCYIELKRYEEAIARGERHLKSISADKMAGALIAGQLAVAYLQKDNFEKCLECMDYYWKLYQDYLENREKYMEYSLPVTNTCFHERRRALFLGSGIRAAVRLGRDTCVWQYFRRIGWDSPRDYVDTEVIRDILKRMLETEGDAKKRYTEMCDILLAHEEWKSFVLREMMENCEKQKTFTDRIQAAAIYRDAASEHWVLNLMRLAAAAFLPGAESDCGEARNEHNIEGTAEEGKTTEVHGTDGQTGMAGSIAEKITEKAEYCSREESEEIASEAWRVMEESMPLMKAFDIFGAVEQFGGDNRQVVENIPFLRWEKGIIWYFSRFSWKEARWWTEKFGEILASDSIRMLAWKAAYGISRASGTDADIETILEGLREYALCRTALCERIYREEIIREMPDILSEEDRGAYIIRDLLEHTESGNYAEAVSTVRKINVMLPGLSNIMKQYLKWLEKQMERQKEESRQAAGEFQVLARQIKARLHALLEAGQYQAALAVAEQMLALLPEDKEILQIKEKILEMR